MFYTEVDQLVDVASNLTVGKSTLPSVSTKRVQDEDQQSLQEEGSPKRTHVVKDDMP